MLGECGEEDNCHPACPPTYIGVVCRTEILLTMFFHGIGSCVTHLFVRFLLQLNSTATGFKYSFKLSVLKKNEKTFQDETFTLNVYD